MVLNLVTLMAGRAWDLVDDMEMADLQKEDALDKVFAHLDSAFKPDLMTELPDDFEAFFVKLQRKAGQTLQEYQTEFGRVERRLRASHQVELPEKVKAWWFLRRSGVSREQRQMVMTQIGAERLNLDRWMPPAVAMPTSRSRLTTCSTPKRACGKNTMTPTTPECTGKKTKMMVRTMTLPARPEATRTVSTWPRMKALTRFSTWMSTQPTSRPRTA